MLDTLRSNTSGEMINKLAHTWCYVFIGLILSLLGVLLVMPFMVSIPSWGIFVFIAILIAVLFWFMTTKNPLVYYLFTFCNGFVLVSIISHYISMSAGTSVLLALIMSCTIIGGLTGYALNTTKNYLTMMPILYWSLTALIVVGLLNIFVVGSSFFSFIMAIVGALVFSFFVLHDTQEVINTDISPIEGAMNLYLTVINMFLNLLNVIGFLDD